MKTVVQRIIFTLAICSVTLPVQAYAGGGNDLATELGGIAALSLIDELNQRDSGQYNNLVQQYVDGLRDNEVRLQAQQHQRLQDQLLQEQIRNLQRPAPLNLNSGGGNRGLHCTTTGYGNFKTTNCF